MITRAILEQSDPKAVALRSAIDCMKNTANAVRLATHELLDVDACGASDVTASVLFQVHRAWRTLDEQYALLVESSLAAEEGEPARAPEVTPDGTHEGFASAPSLRSFKLSRVEVHCYHCWDKRLVGSTDEALDFFEAHRHS